MSRDYLKDRYHEAREEAFASGKLKSGQNSGVYTTQMIAALRDMAEANVYPDGHFGDDECIVWEMFHLFHIKADKI